MLPVEVGTVDDSDRWYALTPSLPVMAYGDTEDEAIDALCDALDALWPPAARLH